MDLHYGHAFTCDAETEYNDMAMLWLNGGVKAVKVLMQRGFPHLISPGALAVYFVVYYILAMLTSGTHVPAGLVIPMMVIGGAYGRLMGLGVLEAKKGMCDAYAGAAETSTRRLEVSAEARAAPHLAVSARTVARHPLSVST